MSPQLKVVSYGPSPYQAAAIEAVAAYIGDKGLDTVPHELYSLVDSILPEESGEAYSVRMTCHVACKGCKDIFPILLLSPNPMAAAPSLVALCECITSNPKYDAESAVYTFNICFVPAEFRKGLEGGRIFVPTVTKPDRSLSNSEDEDFKDFARYLSRGGGYDPRGSARARGYRGRGYAEYPDDDHMLYGDRRVRDRRIARDDHNDDDRIRVPGGRCYDDYRPRGGRGGWAANDSDNFDSFDYRPSRSRGTRGGTRSRGRGYF